MRWRNSRLEVQKPTVRFGVFEVDLASGELRKQGVKIKLQEQPFQALVALIERPREILTREELQKRLWPTDPVADLDRGLNKAINRVREALGDDADNPRFIETLPQRGYRFLAPVETARGEPPLPLAVTETNAAPPLMHRRGFLGGLMVVPLMAVGYYLLRGCRKITFTIRSTCEML